MSQSIYRGRQVAFLTQHGKECLVAPIMAPALGCDIARVDGYDTDLLGTFSRDIQREGSQLDTARRKARIGMTLAGSSIGIASEGSFMADPFAGWMPWNVEILIWFDDDLGIEVTGMAQGPAKSAHRSISSIDELRTFAADAGFPEHRLMLRPDDEHSLEIIKGLADWPTLEHSFFEMLEKSTTGRVFAENDLRAFCNPTRQAMISNAAQDLLNKLLSICPHCSSPGYSIAHRKAGLPCGTCNAPTRLPIADIWCCPKCAHTEDIKRSTPSHADPANCDYCNP
jgi:hypothetical protein